MNFLTEETMYANLCFAQKMKTNSAYRSRLDYWEGWRERGRERERERQRQRETETQRQRERHRDRQTDRQTDPAIYV